MQLDFLEDTKILVKKKDNKKYNENKIFNLQKMLMELNCVYLVM